jgi:hypothetical protein
MPERLSLPDIAHVDLHDRLLKCQQGIENGDGGLGQAGSIYDQGISLCPRRLNPVNEHAFMIGLPEIEINSCRGGMLLAASFDRWKTLITVDASQIQAIEVCIRAIQKKEPFSRRHVVTPGLS